MSYFEKIMALTVVVGVAVGGYFLLQSPQLRELIGSGPEPPPVVERPAPAPVQRSAPDPVQKTPSASPPKTPTRSQPPRATSREPEPGPPSVQNQAENQMVARTLLQIMAARGVASGISLTVSDDLIELNGEIPSATRRTEILEIIEKGRANRGVLDHLVLKAP